jgi:iron complex transport system ATP-binding protein
MNPLAVSLRDLGHAYVPATWVFRHYSAQVRKGSVFALLGPNARGKTTLLKILLGVLTPTEGSVEINGSVAFVPQLFQVGFDFTALDMVVMGRARRVGLFSQPSKQDRDAARATMVRLGIADLAARSFHQLSGGQRQLVIFARALVAEATVLLLDEPTSALDLRNQSTVLDWIRRLRDEEGLTVVMTTHHPQHALAVADDALLMTGEADFVSGPAVDVLSEENLHRLYGVDLKRLTFVHDGQTVEASIPIFARSGTRGNRSSKRPDV